jgi:hypothetical protein
MSVRASNVENDISSILGRSSRPTGWRWWGRRRARQELAVREATELLNEFGKDAYWLACIGPRHFATKYARERVMGSYHE